MPDHTLPLGSVMWAADAGPDEVIDLDWVLRKLPSVAADDRVTIQAGGWLLASKHGPAKVWSGGTAIDLVALGAHGERPTGFHVSSVHGPIEGAAVVETSAGWRVAMRGLTLIDALPSRAAAENWVWSKRLDAMAPEVMANG